MSNLYFKADQILERGKGLTFDDVLLLPNHSTISSRRAPQLKTHITKRHQIDIPFVTANMDTITEHEMSCKMSELGGLGILHRFMTVEQQVEQVKKIQDYLKAKGLKSPISASIGVKEDGKLRADILANAGVEILTIDIAHGDSELMIETLDYVKKKYPHIDVIAGNVATPWGVKALIDHGADAIKVGIGPGSMCTTRIITGSGVPQLTAIAFAYSETSKAGIPLIADGGIKNSGDIVKALSAGASCVMMGSMVSATLETPGEVISGMKKYRGMASKAAQVSWRGDLPKGMAAEGVDTLVPCKGPVENIINEMLGGLRSGMTYLDALTLKEMYQKAYFIEMTASGMVESKPHGLK